MFPLPVKCAPPSAMRQANARDDHKAFVSPPFDEDRSVADARRTLKPFNLLTRTAHTAHTPGTPSFPAHSLTAPSGLRSRSRSPSPRPHVRFADEVPTADRPAYPPPPSKTPKRAPRSALKGAAARVHAKEESDATDEETDGETDEDEPPWRTMLRALRASPYMRACAASAPVRGLTAFILGNAGLLLVACAQLFGACMNVSVKVLNKLDPPVPVLELILVRMVITYVCCVGYMSFAGVAHPFAGPPGVRRLLVCRGMSGFVGLSTMYFALQTLSLADATVITFLAPTTTSLAAYFALGEKITSHELGAGLASMLSVVLIARPPFIFGSSDVSAVPAHPDVGVAPIAEPDGEAHKRVIAVCISLVGVVGTTFAFLSIRAIGKRAHALHNMAFFSSMCIMASVVGMVASGTALVLPTQPLWLALLALIGVFGFCAQLLLTLGLQRETATRATLGMYVQIVFASLFDALILRSPPAALSLAGTAIILGAGVYVTVAKESSQQGTGASASAINGGKAVFDADAEMEEGLLASHVDEREANEYAGEDMESVELVAHSGLARSREETS